MTQNILKNPIIKSGVDPASRVAACIDVFCRRIDGSDEKVGSGTGFFHRRGGKTFLITNWHVLTGRKPEDPSSMLSGYPDSPTGFQVHLARKNNPNHFVPTDILPLYEDGKPVWIETTAAGRAAGRIDLVAIEFKFEAGDEQPMYTPVEQFAPAEGGFLSVGRDVVIIGYPFGISAANPYPMWKRAYVASEPAILIGGLPKFYIDSPGRPGMSGSPIFMISRGINVPVKPGTKSISITSLEPDALKNAHEVNILHFAGVYSGAVGDRSLEVLNVGVAWHAAFVDYLFTDPVEGSNPFPPSQL